jgi:aryl-alcohol dehydrogenase-like predicted oxidoreductase
MHYRRLGRTGILVSEISLGTGTFGGKTEQALGFGALGREQVAAIVGEAVNAGVNLIDTADTYNEGEAETLLGQALKDLAVPRSNIVLTTKVCDRTGPGPNDVGGSRSHILHSVEESLRRLQTDYIDLYLIHHFDPITPLEETLYSLDMLIRQGNMVEMAVLPRLDASIPPSATPPGISIERAPSMLSMPCARTPNTGEFPLLK